VRALIIGLLFAAPLLTAAGRPSARELAERVIANQRRDDLALYDYERVQRRVSYEEGAVASDHTYRVVPTGTGHLSLLVKRGDRPVSPAEYRKELREWQEVLGHAIDPSDPREVHSENVRRRRDRKRWELYDAIGEAFHFTWLGEKVEDGRLLAHIGLDPNPAYRPTSRETEILRHVHAKVWVDVRAGQLVRGRADITSDVSTGGGILGKIYRGGWYELEQERVAPGIWLATRTAFSIEGRMLMFSFAEHKLEVTSRYRYVGTPRQALEAVREELDSGARLPAKR
jgi:hypothetical protein